MLKQTKFYVFILTLFAVNRDPKRAGSGSSVRTRSGPVSKHTKLSKIIQN